MTWPNPLPVDPDRDCDASHPALSPDFLLVHARLTSSVGTYCRSFVPDDCPVPVGAPMPHRPLARREVVGRGPEFAYTWTTAEQYGRLCQLVGGDEVHVLLDNGEVVSCTWGMVLNSELVWVVELGNYAAGRVRPAGGWSEYVKTCAALGHLLVAA